MAALLVCGLRYLTCTHGRNKNRGKASHCGRSLTLAVVSKEERKLWCCIAVSIPGAQAVGQGLHLASQMLQDLQWAML